MNLIGQSVTHKKWGSGIIESQTENSLSVRFEFDGMYRSFKFPDAFRLGFLEGATSESANKILQALESRKCECCGNEHMPTERIDGKRLCKSCKLKTTVHCPVCNGYYHKNKMTVAFSNRSTYATIQICEHCANTESFLCSHCGTRCLNTQKAPKTALGKELCVACINITTKVCNFCNTPFDIGSGSFFYRDHKTINVCPACKNDNTFKCSSCGSIELISSRVSSKYISVDSNICDSCVRYCAVCNEAIPMKSMNVAFGKHFCDECWDKDVISCNICGEDFYPGDAHDKWCPDCVEMDAYKRRLLGSDILGFSYYPIGYYDLEYVDRCKLFTNLYRYCTQSESRLALDGELEIFKYLVMHFANKRIVVTYLPEEIKGNVRYSEDVTMTEFRSKKGRKSVWEALLRWEDCSDNYMDTTAGRMKILNYPVRLRVQTSYDKVYGKQWDGPYGYIEIGNYGDTTEFYVVGILE